MKSEFRGYKNMWKRNSDVFPSEWVGTSHEEEFEKELEIGDRAKVIVDSQFQDYFISTGKKYPRAIGKTGRVKKIDTSDEWAYFLSFGSEMCSNWFKRYCLEKQ